MFSARTKSPNPGESTTPYQIDGQLPVIRGRGLAKMRVVDQLWAEETHSSHGKTRSSSVSYSMVGWLCHGQAEHIGRVFFGGKPVADLNEWRNGRDYVERSIGWNAYPLSFRIYYGTETQTTDPTLNGTAKANAPGLNGGLYTRRSIPPCPHLHPAYKGIVYIVIYRLNFDMPGEGGAGNRTLPDLSFEVYVPNSEEVSAASDTKSWGVSWPGITYDCFTNPRWGLGQSKAVFKPETWKAQADLLAYEGFSGLDGDKVTISPRIEESRPCVQHLADIMSYGDGFLSFEAEEIIPGWIPNQTYELPALTTLSVHDGIGKMEQEPISWEEAVSEVTVKFTNGEYDQNLQPDTAVERNPATIAITGDPRREEVEVKAILYPPAACAAGQRALAQLGFLKARYRRTYFRDRAVHPSGKPIRKGDLFRCNHEPWGLNVVVRVIEREEVSPHAVKLYFETEEGRAAEPYIPANDPRETPPDPVAEPFLFWRLWMVPPALLDKPWPPRVAILAQKEHPSIYTAEVFLSGDDDWAGEEQQLEDLGRFVDRSELAVNLGPTGNPLVTVTGAEASALTAVDYSDADIRDGSIILLIDDELMVLKGLDAISGDDRTLTVTRGAFGTVAVGHNAGADVWILPRVDIPLYAHAMFRPLSPYSVAAASLFFTLTPVNGYDLGETTASKQVIIPNPSPTWDNPSPPPGTRYYDPLRWALPAYGHCDGVWLAYWLTGDGEAEWKWFFSEDRTWHHYPTRFGEWNYQLYPLYDGATGPASEIHTTTLSAPLAAWNIPSPPPGDRNFQALGWNLDAVLDGVWLAHWVTGETEAEWKFFGPDTLKWIHYPSRFGQWNYQLYPLYKGVLMPPSSIDTNNLVMPSPYVVWGNYSAQAGGWEVGWAIDHPNLLSHIEVWKEDAYPSFTFHENIPWYEQKSFVTAGSQELGWIRLIPVLKDGTTKGSPVDTFID